MLDQVAGVGGGQQRLAQPRRACATVAGLLADAFAALPGALALVDPAPVEDVDSARTQRGDSTHGRNLHLKVRPEAPVQLLLTGHMDTVFAADHPFQALPGSRTACSAAPASPT